MRVPWGLLLIRVTVETRSLAVAPSRVTVTVWPGLGGAPWRARHPKSAAHAEDGVDLVVCDACHLNNTRFMSQLCTSQPVPTEQLDSYPSVAECMPDRISTSRSTLSRAPPPPPPAPALAAAAAVATANILAQRQCAGFAPALAPPTPRLVAGTARRRAPSRLLLHLVVG